MRPRESNNGVLDALVGRSGVTVFAGLTALMILIPWRLSHSLGSNAADEADEWRGVAQIVLEESWGSEGFADLADAISRLPDRPSQESIRRLMEEQGRTDLHFSRRLRWVMRDGQVNVITYHRKPYEDLGGVYREELLDFLDHGPESTPRLLFDEAAATRPEK